MRRRRGGAPRIGHLPFELGHAAFERFESCLFFARHGRDFSISSSSAESRGATSAWPPKRSAL